MLSARAYTCFTHTYAILVHILIHIHKFMYVTQTAGGGAKRQAPAGAKGADGKASNRWKRVEACA